MDGHLDGLPSYTGHGSGFFLEPLDVEHLNDHFSGAVTLPVSHDESCMDLDFDHIACRGPDSNNQHHPVPNHNHPLNPNNIPMHARRHHSLSTMPALPNYFDPRGQMPLGFGSDAIMSPTVPMGFGLETPNSSPQIEDDSTSAACSSVDCNRCVSECGASEAGDICTDEDCAQACDDDDCDEAAAQCTDAECPANDILSEKDKAAADVLASIGGDTFAQDSIMAPSMPSMPSMSSQYYATQSPYQSGEISAASQNHFHPGGMTLSMAHSMNMGNPYQSNPNLYNTVLSSFAGFGDPATSAPADWMVFGMHLNEHAHDQTNCIQPCLTQNRNLPTRCPLPHLSHAHPGGLDLSFCMPDPNSSEFIPCGAELNGVEDWTSHFQEQHVASEGQHHNYPHATQHSYPPLMPPNRQPHFLPGPRDGLLDPTHAAQDKESTTSPLGLQASSSPQPSPATAQTLPSPDKTGAEVFTCQWVIAGQICGMSYSNDDALQAHCKERHIVNLGKTDAGYKCCWEGCAREGHFTQKSKLERHLQTHTGFKPVKCEICNTPLSAKQSLAQHMRIHTGEKPWSCKFPGCKASFKQQSALTMHSRTHTGEKPLKCEVCGKAFGESSNLSKHRKTHNVKGAFKCDFCDKDFHRLDQKRRHEKIHRKDVNAPKAAKPTPSIKKTQGGRVTKASDRRNSK